MLIGKLFNNIPEKFKHHEFRNLSFDSRNCKLKDIFFSIKGTNNNGNNFIKNAIKNGARTIISDLNYQGLKMEFFISIVAMLEKLCPTQDLKFILKNQKI